MRISDWSSDVCSSDLAPSPCARSPTPGGPCASCDASCGPERSCTSWSTGSHPTRPWPSGSTGSPRCSGRSEERRVGKELSVRVDLGGRRIIKKKTNNSNEKRTQNKLQSKQKKQ